MDKKTVAAKRRVMDKTLVELVRSKYPRYDKTLHSKVRRPEDYGVQLVAGARKLIEEVYGLNVLTSLLRDVRRLPCRVSCRLSERDRARLQLAMAEDNHITVQDELHFIITDYLDRKEKAKSE
jgi:hypothetical protein